MRAVSRLNLRASLTACCAFFAVCTAATVRAESEAAETTEMSAVSTDGATQASVETQPEASQTPSAADLEPAESNSSPVTDTAASTETVDASLPTYQTNTNEGVSGTDASTSADEELTESPKYAKHAFLLTYDMAVPVGDTWRFVGAFSPSGCTFDYRYHFTPHLAAGALIGWNSFEIKERGTFIYDNVTVTGTQIRSLDVMHFGANFHANFLPVSARAVPYVGLDLAAYHTWRLTDFGWWSAGQSDWHFGVAPSLGVLVHLPGITLVLGSKFQAAVKTSRADSEMYVSFNIGVGLD